MSWMTQKIAEIKATIKGDQTCTAMLAHRSPAKREQAITHAALRAAPCVPNEPLARREFLASAAKMGALVTLTTMLPYSSNTVAAAVGFWDYVKGALELLHGFIGKMIGYTEHRIALRNQAAVGSYSAFNGGTNMDSTGNTLLYADQGQRQSFSDGTHPMTGGRLMTLRHSNNATGTGQFIAMGNTAFDPVTQRLRDLDSRSFERLEQVGRSERIVPASGWFGVDTPRLDRRGAERAVQEAGLDPVDWKPVGGRVYDPAPGGSGSEQFVAVAAYNPKTQERKLVV